ncbi:hypothetical protein [Neisseria iguanae]|uniref:Uncharacterized protein n=1 Tax=Neisseria iguanae TaxID=90242 RepID=A0A2P7TX03_9NEIS|nr:hypothetical protein [Neisseria iguanae]PSJ79237.1 hypothetical protein C7N83_13440 [Neisseria iguanae]
MIKINASDSRTNSSKHAETFAKFPASAHFFEQRFPNAWLVHDMPARSAIRQLRIEPKSGNVAKVSGHLKDTLQSVKIADTFPILHNPL